MGVKLARTFTKNHHTTRRQLHWFVGRSTYLVNIFNHLVNHGFTEPDFIFYLSGVDVLKSDKLGRLHLSVEGCKKVLVVHQKRSSSYPSTGDMETSRIWGSMSFPTLSNPVSVGVVATVRASTETEREHKRLWCFTECILAS